MMQPYALRAMIHDLYKLTILQRLCVLLQLVVCTAMLDLARAQRMIGTAEKLSACMALFEPMAGSVDEVHNL